MPDEKLRQLERLYTAEPTDENFDRLTKERERSGLLGAFAMVNGFGYFVPKNIETRAELQPYVDFVIQPSDLIDIHDGGVRTLPYDA